MRGFSSALAWPLPKFTQPAKGLPRQLATCVSKEGLLSTLPPPTWLRTKSSYHAAPPTQFACSAMATRRTRAVPAGATAGATVCITCVKAVGALSLLLMCSCGPVICAPPESKNWISRKTRVPRSSLMSSGVPLSFHDRASQSGFRTMPLASQTWPSAAGASWKKPLYPIGQQKGPNILTARMPLKK